MKKKQIKKQIIGKVKETFEIKKDKDKKSIVSHKTYPQKEAEK